MSASKDVAGVRAREALTLAEGDWNHAASLLRHWAECEPELRDLLLRRAVAWSVHRAALGFNEPGLEALLVES
jgi:hypothetical protein